MNATITKSIRLSQDESRELHQLSETSLLSEAALMKKWILEGMKMEKLERAIQAYQKRQTDLRGGAAMAGISYNRFMREIEARNIVILDNGEHFYDSLLFLADSFDAPELRHAVEEILAKGNEPEAVAVPR
jgi:predicted HTH domain antitoxin